MLGRFFDGKIDNPIFFVIGDLLIYLAGVGTGGLVIGFLLTYALKDVHISREFKENEDLNMCQVIDDDTGKSMTYLNPRTFKQTTENLIGFFIWRYIIRRKSNYKLHKKKQATILFWILMLLMAFLMFSAIFSMITIQELVQ